MEKSFWNGKNVFITGHTGFKGTWLTYWLCCLRAIVTGYSLYPIENMYGYLNFNGLNDVRADILDGNRLKREMCKAQPEIVIHLAAKSIIADCLSNPEEAYKTNVIGTVNLFESVLNCKSVKTVLCVTSDKVYFGECDKTGFKENGVSLGALEHYSATKVCQEVIADSYRNCQFADRDLAIVTARASNVLGGGDYLKGRLIVSVFESFKRGESVIIRSPGAIRPWQNMMDCLDGYLTLAQKSYEDSKSYNSGFNIGPCLDGMRSVEWVVKKMAEFWGDGASYITNKTENVMNEKEILRLNIDKSIEMLGWIPKWSLQDTLRQIVTFEKSIFNNTPHQEAVDNIIAEHMNR